jgi:hypothetical protein
MRLVVAAIVLVVGPTLARAYCVGADKSLSNYQLGYYSVAHEFERSQYVIAGQIIREVWLGEDGKETRLKPPFQPERSRPSCLDRYIGCVLRHSGHEPGFDPIAVDRVRYWDHPFFAGKFDP